MRAFYHIYNIKLTRINAGYDVTHKALALTRLSGEEDVTVPDTIATGDHRARVRLRAETTVVLKVAIMENCQIVKP